MLNNLLVLGQVPGTNFYITFYGYVIAAGLVVSGLYIERRFPVIKHYFTEWLMIRREYLRTLGSKFPARLLVR